MPANSNGQFPPWSVAAPSGSPARDAAVRRQSVDGDFERFEIEFFERGNDDTSSPIDQGACPRPRRGVIDFWPLLSRLPLKVIVRST
ncbi:MAG: hypothetical protein JXP73_18845 [Deltaproteobacteria bacterium]|nr:hypothetical protein [Deltaproteobacteria bacterium]